MIPKYTSALPWCASKEIAVDGTRWISERRTVVFDFITEQLLMYGRRTYDVPKKCIAAISPELANSIGCHNPIEFDSIVLGIPVDFKINWLLKDTILQLEIS